MDNVSVALDLVSPDVFSTSLPFTVSSGVPGTGAGDLENGGSVDKYDFTTTSQSNVELDFSNCSSSLTFIYWEIDNATDGSLERSDAGCGSSLVSNLPAGDHTLVITNPGSHGTYELSAFTAPAHQVVSVSLPASISNGSPSTGAGNLETTASVDEYSFSTAVDGGVQIDLSDCASSLRYFVYWSIVDSTTGSTLNSGAGCGSTLVSILPAGSYHLVVSHSGVAGTYDLGLSLVASPQTFDVTLPVAVSDGSPESGAGNLETTSAEDDYRFTLASAGAVQVDFSGCDGSLGYYVNWKLVNNADGSTVHSDSSCGSAEITDLAAGQYRLVVTKNGSSGTYHLGIGLVPPADTFNVSLPISVSNGDPSAGAGNLETTSSEDDYRFTLASAGAVQVDFSSCDGSLGYYVNWKLIDEADDSVAHSESSCGSSQITGLDAGNYRLVVTKNGASGTYRLGVGEVPPADLFNVSLPVSVSDGTPDSGAGNLETTSSEDDYRFSLASAGAIQVDFSSCDGSLGYYVNWKLIDEADGSTVHAESSCGSSQLNGLGAGNYHLAVTRNGQAGTYQLGISLVPPADMFSVSLPASISNGTPSSGAGNLETTSSEDDYQFTLGSAGALQVDLSNCDGSLGWYVNWKLVDTSDSSTVHSESGCGSSQVTGLDAGTYRLVVTKNGASGTYQLGVGVVPPPDVFSVSLPASISNGVPTAGAGNLETTSSEDDYQFTFGSSGTLHVDLTSCAGSLGGGYVIWKLVDDTNSPVANGFGCGSQTESLPAGDYTLQITNNGHHGTYELDISKT